MKEISKEIKDSIYNEFIETKYLGEEEMENKLSQMVGGESAML